MKVTALMRHMKKLHIVNYLVSVHLLNKYVFASPNAPKADAESHVVGSLVQS